MPDPDADQSTPGAEDGPPDSLTQPPEMLASPTPPPEESARSQRAFHRLLTSILLAGTLGAVVFYGGLYFLALPAIRSADSLLAAIRDESFDEAYARVSSTLQSFMTQQEFEAWCRTHSLLEMESINWDRRAFAGKMTELRGTIQTAAGPIKLHVQMVRQDRDWKLYAIGSPEIVAADHLPEEKSLQLLARSTFNRIGRSIEQKDFAPLYRSTSTQLRERLGEQELNERLSFLIRQQIELSPASIESLRWTVKPQISQQRVLHLEGTATTSQSDIAFEFQYVHEAGDWRIGGLELKSTLRILEVLNSFVGLMKKQERPEAFELCSSALRKRGQEQFFRLVNQLELDRVEQADWSEEFRILEQINPNADADASRNRFYATGDIVLKTGRRVSLGFTMIVEDGQWRIDGIAPAVPANPPVS